MPVYVVTMSPPKGKPQTFKDEDPVTGEERTRPLRRTIELQAADEDDARDLAVQQAINIARAEAETEIPADPDDPVTVEQKRRKHIRDHAYCVRSVKAAEAADTGSG